MHMQASDVRTDCDEAFSTEQAVKAAQLGDGPDSTDGIVLLEAGHAFDLVLASDVIYSLGHARRLPAVVERRLSARGRFVAMVPVRSAMHTRAFLDGLLEHGLLPSFSQVSPSW